MMPTTFAMPFVAQVDLPSFPAVPWLGLLLFAAFVAVLAATIAAARWMVAEDERLDLPRMDRWRLAIAGLLAALLVGTMTFGILALPVVAVGLPLVVGAFTAQRDKRVAPEDRLLTKDGLRILLRDLKKAREASRTAAAASPAKQPRQSLVERLKGLLATAGRRAGKGVTAGVGTKGATGPKPDLAIRLLKKDGSPALARDEDDAGGQVSDNVRNAQAVMIAAMRAGATDVHIEPHEQQYFVRMRVDGVLKNLLTYSMGDGRGVISALKVVSDMDISERRRPQDGTFSAEFAGSKYDIRAASTPTSYGEKMVFRLLNSSGGVLKAGLGNIGLRPQIHEQLKQVIHKPYGMFLVVGPTGSGKTTTVYASLAEIDAQQHNITTIEDPVEYRLDGITQIAVNTAAGVTFASILRSVLRQDPDVLLVGEIRDKETAEIACQAALTGHFVFSTLHANDAVATITRLLDLGLDPMLIQTAVTAVLAQRLARRLCDACKEAYPPPPDLLAKLGVKPEAVPQIYRAKGCAACEGGYKGRFGLHELMVVNDEIRGLITAEPNVNALRAAARKAGSRSLQADGYSKVLKGLTSVEEIVRVTT